MLIGFLPPVIQLRRQERGQKWLWAVGVKRWGGVAGGELTGEMPWQSGIQPAACCCFSVASQTSQVVLLVHVVVSFSFDLMLKYASFPHYHIFSYI